MGRERPRSSVLKYVGTGCASSKRQHSFILAPLSERGQESNRESWHAISGPERGIRPDLILAHGNVRRAPCPVPALHRTTCSAITRTLQFLSCPCANLPAHLRSLRTNPFSNGASCALSSPSRSYSLSGATTPSPGRACNAPFPYRRPLPQNRTSQLPHATHTRQALEPDRASGTARIPHP